MRKKKLTLKCLEGGEDMGGTWMNQRHAHYFLITTMLHWNDESEHEWYGYARVLHNATPSQDAIRQGYGRVIGYTEASDAAEAKQSTLQLVRSYLEARDSKAKVLDLPCPLAFDSAPLSYLDKKRRVEADKDSFAYLKGYLDGSRGRTPKLTSQSYRTGFDHGVSYSRGEDEPPAWLMEMKDANYRT